MPERPQSRLEREKAMADTRAKAHFWQNVLALMIRNYGRIVVDGEQADALGRDEISIDHVVENGQGKVVVSLANGKRTFLGRLRAAWRTLREAS